MSTAKQEKIQQHYDDIADVYDTHYDYPRGRCYHTHLSRHVMKALPGSGALLDIGCGTGLFVEKYLHHGGTAVGIDLRQEHDRTGTRPLRLLRFYYGNRGIPPVPRPIL